MFFAVCKLVKEEALKMTQSLPCLSDAYSGNLLRTLQAPTHDNTFWLPPEADSRKNRCVILID